MPSSAGLLPHIQNRAIDAQVVKWIEMSEFNLKFPLDEVTRWAAEYSYPPGDDKPIAIGEKARIQGFLTRDEFLAIARWKSPRPSNHHLKNDDEMVREVTRFALGTPVESLRLRVLTLLDGVGLRTASAVLHLCHRDPYPMMDVRALWSIGIETKSVDWEAVWPEYVKVCRGLASAAGVDMRTLDRALWAYSEKQGPLVNSLTPQ